MIRSLRGRLLAGTVLGTALVMLCAGAMLHWVLERWLRREFDANLVGRAALLASLVEQEDGGFEFDFDYRAMPEFAEGRRPEYFQIRQISGAVIARSQSLGTDDLPANRGSSQPEFRDISLPDGRPGRLVALVASPRVESRQRSRPEQISVVLARETAGLQTMLLRIREVLLGVGLAAVGITALVLVLVVRRGLRPMSSLAAQIGSLPPNDLSARIDLDSPPRELAPVVDQMNALLQRIQDAMQREKALTAEVAHELRTPLAGLRSTLEVSLSRDREPATYRADLAGCLEITGQMQHMVSNLLCMARLERGAVPTRPEPVALDALLAECWRLFDEAAREKQVELSLPRNGPVEIVSDREILRQVFTNLLDNAVTYVDRGGSISVELQNRDGRARLEIANSGSRLAPEQSPRAFDRFWRGDAARQAAGVHCGLGLPLVRMLVERLGGSIQADSQADGVFRVCVDLPRL